MLVTNPSQSSEQYEQFLTLFAQYHERLFRYVFSLIPNYQDAEDVFQRASLVLWRKFDQLRPDGDFFAWACKVAYFEVRNHRRTYARDRHFFSEELMATLADERAAAPHTAPRQMALLRDCMKGLSQSQRELVEKAYAGGQSIGQVAEELGRAVQTVYNRLYRIRRILFDCVQQKSVSEEVS